MMATEHTNNIIKNPKDHDVQSSFNLTSVCQPTGTCQQMDPKLGFTRNPDFGFKLPASVAVQETTLFDHNTVQMWEMATQ